MDFNIINSSLYLKETLGTFYDENMQYGCAYVGATQLSSKEKLAVICPIDGKKMCDIALPSNEQIDQVVEQSRMAFTSWSQLVAPKRGELLRVYALLLREQKQQMAAIITLESGKPWQESLGEVQELIDVCDFAVGLSRQLYGLTMSTERPQHRMMEQWHPLGPVLVISAFNFPMAVWGWNAALALVCGNSIIWKPSSQCPLSALACHAVLLKAIRQLGMDETISSIIYGEKKQVQNLIERREIALVSATGSCQMGRAVGAQVAKRMGRSLLELGGNNAMIICPSANLDLAVRAIAFSALGTTGQRCTTLRRLIVHESLQVKLLAQLKKVYGSVTMGNPFDENNLLGPVINPLTISKMLSSIELAKQQGGELVMGGKKIKLKSLENGFYITPAIIKINKDAEIVKQETFAPLLFIHSYKDLEEAISIQNSVDQGLSSAIFTNNINEAELFLSAQGSDCGIANVNIGTSGAEIGGAFGGEKDTGGGRESGSDAWKNYMRRATNTINYGSDLPLAQGINFDVT